MTLLTEQLRKAAIVVSSLSASDADALMDQMSPKQAASVRQAVMELDDFDEREEREVLAEFLGLPNHEEVELKLSAEAYNDQLVPPAETTRAEARALLEELSAKTAQQEHQPFEFLSAADPSSLLSFLHDEHPQTIALVLSHLPADRAAEIVVQFPSSIQVDVLRRVAHLDLTSPEILNQVSREVEQQLRDRYVLLDSGSSGVATVQAIMNAAHSHDRNHLLNNVGKSDPHLAKQIRPEPGSVAKSPASAASQSKAAANKSPRQSPQRPRNKPVKSQTNPIPKSRQPAIEFPQLNSLEEREWQVLLHSVNRETLLIALAGADESFVTRVLKKLPYHQAESLRQSVNDIGPLRLSDVEFAQQRIVKAAVRLADKGELRLPTPRRFAAAV
jgi:flagellar motor switch protein FliG